MKSIALSAGHSLSDPGTINKDLRESDLTRKITTYATDYIRTHGVGVINIPDELDLTQTIKYINDRADQLGLCVEVHINSGGGKGIEAWNYVGVSESDKLSQFLVDATVAETGLPNRGIKDESTNRHGRLGFVHDTKPLAALIECGFIDGDYDFLKQEENLKRMAKGVARGIVTYMGVTWRPELVNPTPPAQPTPTPTPPTNPNDFVKRSEFDALKKVVDNLVFISKKIKETL